MKIPNHIQQKMHRIADLHYKAAVLSREVDEWLINRGFDIDELRCGDGYSLEELDYGNDVTDILCERIESGELCSYGERRNSK